MPVEDTWPAICAGISAQLSHGAAAPQFVKPLYPRKVIFITWVVGIRIGDGDGDGEGEGDGGGSGDEDGFTVGEGDGEGAPDWPTMSVAVKLLEQLPEPVTCTV